MAGFLLRFSAQQCHFSYSTVLTTVALFALDQLDRSDASAKLKFEDGSTAWFPVAALSNLSEAGEANESSKSGGSRAGGGSANKRKSKGSKRR